MWAACSLLAKVSLVELLPVPAIDRVRPLVSATVRSINFVVLLPQQGRAFAGRADREYGLDIVGNLKFYELLQAVVINAAVCVHGRH